VPKLLPFGNDTLALVFAPRSIIAIRKQLPTLEIEMENIMASAFCSSCGNSMSAQALACPGCGHPNAANSNHQSNYAGAPRSRVTAAILALFIGGLGIHKFYLGKSGAGIVYLLFCWTFVPAIVAFIEAIIYFTQSDEAFAASQRVNVV
jgi:hypothetical protein